MNDLQELHIKGELSEKGYLKETYDNDIQDLKHELTDLGKMELRDLFKDPKYRQEFLKLALEEARKNPECYKQIVLAAMNKIKEYTENCFNLRMGDIQGSTESSGFSKEEILSDISDEIDDLKEKKYD